MHLIRKQIVYEVKNDAVIDYNYNYDIMKYLYEAMTEINPNKALQLHEDGYKIEGKTYKLFNFILLFENAEFVSEGIKVKTDDKVKLVVSGESSILDNMIKGIMKIGELRLNRCLLKPFDLLNDKPVKFKNKMLYKVYSPIIEKSYDPQKSITRYTNPMQKEFYSALAYNLKRKYKIIYNKDYDGEIYFDIENTLKIKSKAINQIKGNGQIKGTGKYEMWVQANTDMQRVAYYCGLGQNNSTGAGFLGYIVGRDKNREDI